MKIGIITLSASDNCGSLLQCYALKRILEAYGDVEIINFSSVKSHQVYDYLPPLSAKTIKPIIKRFVFNRDYNRLRLCEKKGYSRFRHKYLSISGKEYYKDDLKELKNRYDVVVVGSDQVWNVMMSDFDESFFAHWANSKKIAYAPSLGGHDIREHNDSNRFIEYIKEFSEISVREDRGKACLEEILEKKVEKVLDPTLVLSSEEWKKLIGKPIIKGDYYFYYSWAYNCHDFSCILSEESKKTQTPVIVTDSRKWKMSDLAKWSFILPKNQGPLAFLNYMFYAKRAYVESFHGMIFAYIFRKNFWLFDTHEKYEDIDARLKDLLDLLNMSNRVLTVSNVKEVNQATRINYLCNNRLTSLRENSISFIRKSLL